VRGMLLLLRLLLRCEARALLHDTPIAISIKEFTGK
jgi:hypothetical protein